MRDFELKNGHRECPFGLGFLVELYACQYPEGRSIWYLSVILEYCPPGEKGKFDSDIAIMTYVWATWTMTFGLNFRISVACSRVCL
jgi:hypothetical protein